ncbi:MAG TPA: hypothetical protein VE467_01610, partial [Chryseolinea sp.]|nr:hypothetical protein [Chryseolinea sp.]
MVRMLLCFLCFLLAVTTASGQSATDSVTHSLYFIGDAGEPFIVNSSIGDVIRYDISKSDVPSTVLYLGDNVYPQGMPDPDNKKRDMAEKTLET